MKIYIYISSLLLCSCGSNFHNSVKFNKSNNQDNKIISKSNKKKSDQIFVGVNDPIEPWNRVMFEVNRGIFEKAIYPVVKGYNYVVPFPIRKGVKNFHNNLLYPKRFFNNVFQLKLDHAWVETKRAIINTTLGVGGLLDPATTKYNLQFYDQDFGLTLGKYNWDPKLYIYLPILGATSGRDIIGKIGDSFLNPLNYVVPQYYSQFLNFNNLSFTSNNLYKILNEEYDPYKLNHSLYSIQRRATNKHGISYKSEPQSPYVQSIYAALVKPEDNLINSELIERKVNIKGFRKPLRYTVWKNKEFTKSIFIIPGLGDHRNSNLVKSLAELAYRSGYNVISFSNIFNWDFISSAPQEFLPGYVFEDLKLIKTSINHIEVDLLNNDKKFNLGERSIMGMSLGAWYVLNLASDKDFKCSKYVAINPPVNLFESLNVIDSLYDNVFKNKNKKEVIKMINEASLKAFMSLRRSTSSFDSLPFTNEEASFLVGTNFRFSLRKSIFAGQYEEVTSFYDRRNEIYSKLDNLSFLNYYKKIMRPFLKFKGISDQKINSSVNIKNRLNLLKRGQDITIFLSENDFLIKKSDLLWFKINFKDKVYINDKGGHLGNLIHPQVREQISNCLN